MNPTPHSTARRRPALATLGAALGLGVAVLFSAGCGSGSALYETGKSGDQAAGKALFVQKCGSCHTLGDAGTTGQIGPNLDYAFYASRRDGLGESTFVQVVRGQIAYPIAHTSTGAPGMPKNLVTGSQADDIASYVGRVAGTEQSMNAKPPATPPPATTTPPAGGGSTRRRRGRQGRVQLRRLRWLPHARRRGIDRERRPEPRRGQAGRGPRQGARHERQGTDAVVQGPAQRPADRRRRRVRLERCRQVAPAAASPLRACRSACPRRSRAPCGGGGTDWLLRLRTSTTTTTDARRNTANPSHAEIHEATTIGAR